MIEFHGDNKLLSEFVIMCHRSNNAIAKLTLWLSNGLCMRSFERMQAMCLFLRARTVIKLSCEQSEHFRKYRWRAAKTIPFPGSFRWLGVAAKNK